MDFWQSLSEIEKGSIFIFFVALIIAFAFEFINGFHDTANAVATIIYSNTLSPIKAVIYSGFCNALGVILGGTAVAFGIINLLPVDILADSKSDGVLVMIFALLISGVIWNFGTWYKGIPVSSSHTLIGSILGVGLANCLIANNDVATIKWEKIIETGMALLFSPFIGLIAAFILFLIVKFIFRNKKLYEKPDLTKKPPFYVRWVLIGTCGGVSFAHGSNDGQKGIGLLMLVLVGFLPYHYSLNIFDPNSFVELKASYSEVKAIMPENKDLEKLKAALKDANSFKDIPKEKRWEVRTLIFNINQSLKKANITKEIQSKYSNAIEFVPMWAIIGTALALGIGTTVGYKRIVVTVAEKIGKQHLTYAQGATAETVTAATILIATGIHLPVSTTQILSSSVAGTMLANKSGVCPATAKKILLAWIFTLPVTMIMSGTLFLLGKWILI